MADSYDDIKKRMDALQAELQALQKQADEAKKAEVDEVISKMKVAIAHYGITAGQLGFRQLGAGKAATANGAKSKQGLPPLYRGSHGQTWSGRGRVPGWFSEELAKQSFGQRLGQSAARLLSPLL